MHLVLHSLKALHFTGLYWHTASCSLTFEYDKDCLHPRSLFGQMNRMCSSLGSSSFLMLMNLGLAQAIGHWPVSLANLFKHTWWNLELHSLHCQGSNRMLPQREQRRSGSTLPGPPITFLVFILKDIRLNSFKGSLGLVKVLLYEPLAWLRVCYRKFYGLCWLEPASDDISTHTLCLYIYDWLLTLEQWQYCIHPQNYAFKFQNFPAK